MILRLRHKGLLLAMVGLATLFFGCASAFKPRPHLVTDSMKRAQTKTEDEVTVTATVLSAQECYAQFGVNLYSRNIQPIWLEIENNSQEAVWFLPVGSDPHYYTPLESSLLNRKGIRKSDHSAMNRYFYNQGMKTYIAPQEQRSGFIFTTPDEGTKTFNVDIVGNDRRMRSFTFFVPVPGIRIDHHDIDWENLYPADQIVQCDEKGLKKALEEFPCCTSNKKGTEQGDPLNIVVIGNLEDVYYAFIRAGWDETETINRASLLKTARSFLFGGRYRYSPVSSLYVYGRPQDIALQRARTSIHERNHLRLWLSPFRFEGQLVWIGQISRDIGVRFTSKTIVTHKIDTDVDETRNFLIQDLWYSQGLEKFGYVNGVGESTFAKPGNNLTGDPYFSDGLRAVLWVSSHPKAFSQVEVVDWEFPPPR